MAKKKFIEPIVNKEFYAWIAPDGSIQTGLMVEDYAGCMGMAKLFHRHGLSLSVFEMRQKGFTIEKVKVNIVPTNEEIPQLSAKDLE